jgi:hypothetical protein
MEFITTPVRQRKCRVAIPYAGEGGREIGEPMRDEMHDLAFALDAAARSYTVASAPESVGAIEAICFNLIDQVFPLTKGIRLLGVTLSWLEGKAPNAVSQLRLGI